VVALAAATIMKRKKKGKVFGGIGHEKFEFFFLHATKLNNNKDYHKKRLNRKGQGH
jgi:hypothetical protein